MKANNCCVKNSRRIYFSFTTHEFRLHRKTVDYETVYIRDRTIVLFVRKILKFLLQINKIMELHVVYIDGDFPLDIASKNLDKYAQVIILASMPR